MAIVDPGLAFGLKSNYNPESQIFLSPSFGLERVSLREISFTEKGWLLCSVSRCETVSSWKGYFNTETIDHYHSFLPDLVGKFPGKTTNIALITGYSEKSRSCFQVRLLVFDIRQEDLRSVYSPRNPDCQCVTEMDGKFGHQCAATTTIHQITSYQSSSSSCPQRRLHLFRVQETCPGFDFSPDTPCYHKLHTHGYTLSALEDAASLSASVSSSEYSTVSWLSHNSGIYGLYRLTNNHVSLPLSITNNERTDFNNFRDQIQFNLEQAAKEIGCHDITLIYTSQYVGLALHQVFAGAFVSKTLDEAIVLVLNSTGKAKYVMTKVKMGEEVSPWDLPSAKSSNMYSYDQITGKAPGLEKEIKFWTYQILANNQLRSRLPDIVTNVNSVLYWDRYEIGLYEESKISQEIEIINKGSYTPGDNLMNTLLSWLS